MWESVRERNVEDESSVGRREGLLICVQRQRQSHRI